MGFPSRVAVGVALLAVALVPATAEGATKRADLRATGLVTSEDAVEAGKSFVAFGRVANRKGRRATTGRMTFTLRSSRTARNGAKLAGVDIRRTRGGQGRLFKVPMVITSSQAAGDYFLFACVRHKGRSGRGA